MNLSGLSSRLRWWSNRLRAMGPAEVLSRLGDAGRFGWLRLRLDAVKERAAKQRSRECRVPQGDGQLSRIDFPSQRRVLSIAAPWLNHRATLFNQPDVRLGKTIDWRKDYRTGVIGPLKFSAFINHRDARVTGDVKYIWELNRLQHLVPLLLAGGWTEREHSRNG